MPRRPMPDFYRGLPILSRFSDIADPERFAAVPRDWSVVIADVTDSTGAIRAGRYKDVNVLAASVLAGVIRAFGTFELPFIFGGDGATLVVPDSLLPAVTPSLVEARRRGRDAFGLELRAGIVPMRELQADGFGLGLARIAAGGLPANAAFDGDALAEAERRIKEAPERYAPREQNGRADISGLECRWAGIPSPGGVMLSVMVTPTRPGRNHEVLRDVLALIAASHPDENPVAEDRLSISTLAETLDCEHRLKHPGLTGLRRSLSLGIMRAHTAFGRRLIENRLNLGPGLDLSEYKRDVVRHCDHRKYDGTLRLVLATDPARRAALEDRLEERRRAGDLAYGTHADTHAILTCMVLGRKTNHLHFIDVDNGGYAHAAAQLKERMADGRPSATADAPVMTSGGTRR